jgi:capsid protein
MIKKVVEFENKEELAELEERKRKLEEAKGYLIQSNTVTEDQKRAERELEQYVLQQQAELNTKMDNQWRREDQARVGLMTDVYSNMREVVQRKRIIFSTTFNFYRGNYSGPT